MSKNCANSKLKHSLLDNIRVQQEPRGEISRYLLAVDLALKSKGITLMKTPFSELRSVYESNEQSWNNIVPFFDTSTQSIGDENAACFVAYDENGEAVATSAVRVWNLNGSTLRNEVESMRLLYGENAPAWRERADVTLSAPIASQLSGSMMYRGAYWVLPKHRGKGLNIIVSLARYYALGQWPVDYEVTFGSEAWSDPAIRDLYQFEGHQGDIKVRIDGELKFKGYLLWARTSFMLDKLESLTHALNSSSQLSYAQQPSLRDIALDGNNHP